MAFEAILTIDDKTFKVVSFSYRATRDYDRSGRPTSILHGNKMFFVVEHSSDCVFLHQWTGSQHDIKSGKITFMQRNSYQKLTELRFEGGYVVDIEVLFTNEGDMPMTEKFTICAEKYEYESQGVLAAYDMEWPSHT